MSIGYLVSSAINTRFGVFNTAERLAQTLATINSIKARDPSAHITLIEMAALPLTVFQKAVLNSAVNVLIEFSDNETVKNISLNDNWDVVKNMTEMLCFLSALKLIDNNKEQYKSVTRFVKVSGRYLLTEDYSPTIFDAAPDKIFFAARKESHFDESLTGGVTHQYMSRCWSFPAIQLGYIASTFQNMLTRMNQELQNGRYLDIEHLLFTYIDESLICEVDKIGVQGNIGPNGNLVKD